MNRIGDLHGRTIVVCLAVVVGLITACEQWFRDPLSLPGRDTNIVRPPTIVEQVLVIPSSTGARFFWRTDKPTDAEIFTGLTAALLSLAQRDDRMLLNHALAVEGLQPQTRYHAQARSTDPLGNSVTSPVIEFFTLASTAVSSGKPDLSSRVTITATFAATDPLAQQAVWIEDANGAYVRTLFVSQYAKTHPVLTEWWSTSSGGVDAIAGATKQPGTHVFVWNCTDRWNVIVGAGTYRFRVETRSETPGTRVSCTGTILVGNAPQYVTATPAGFCTALSAEYQP